jgi:WD40 repeat protein
MADVGMTDRAHDAATARERKTRVFLSYSRKDAPFAARLVTALNERGLDAFIDKKDISPGEAWQERLAALILSADAVVYVISPDSVASKICSWEIETTEAQHKKLAPVLYRVVPDSDIPPRLARLNFVFLRDSDDFETGVSELVTAVETDIDWIREHTRLGELARRWHDAQPRSEGLLRGQQLTAAERWRDARPKGAPPATDEQLAFISASRRGATQRQRWAIGGAIAAAAIAFALAGLAYTQRNQAVINEQRAVANEVLANDNAARATRERDQALRTQSLFLADLAQQKTAEGDATTAMLLSLEALPGGGSPAERPYVSEAEVSLYAGRFSRGRGLQEIAVLRGHGDQLLSSAFSPDGSRIVTTSSDHTARLWNAHSGVALAVLKGHRDRIGRAIFNRDSTRLLTAARDGTARIWDTTTGTAVAVLSHGEALNFAAFVANETRVLTVGSSRALLWSSDGNRIAQFGPEQKSTFQPVSIDDARERFAVAGPDFNVRVVDASTGSDLAILRGHTDQIRRIAFSDNGARIATASEDATARVWDSRGVLLATFTYPRPADEDTAFNPDLAINADGTLLAAAEDDAVLYDVRTQQPLAQLGGHRNPVNDIAFSRDGRRLLSKSVDAVRLWDAATGKEVAPLLGYQGTSAQAAHFSDDSRHLVTTSHDGTARLWDAHTGGAVALMSGHEGSVWDAAFSPDGRYIVTQSETTARLWSAPPALPVLVLNGHSASVTSAAFSRDGRKIVSSSPDRTSRIWDASNGSLLGVLTGHTAHVTDAAFHPDGTRIVTASLDGTLRIWNGLTATAAQTLSVERLRDWQRAAAAFSSDGRRVLASLAGRTRAWDLESSAEALAISGGDARFTDGSEIITTVNDSVVHLWDVRTGAALGTLDTQESPIDATISADGTRLVTTAGSETGDARAIVWDTRAKTRISVAVSDNGEQFNTARFSPDNSRIVTSSSDGTARIWDTATGALVAVLAGHTGPVLGAAFAGDGQRVVSTGDDRTIRVWSVFPQTAKLIEQSILEVTRCLTIAERRAFFLGDEPPLWCVERRKFPYDTAEWQSWLDAKRRGETVALPQ